MKKKLKSLNKTFHKVLELTSQLARSSGYRAYIVGGVARDLILGKDIYDLDIVIEGDAIALAGELARRLHSGFVKHHVFGTATIEYEGFKVDFATARTEIYTSWGVLPKVTPASLREDLFRRDFTINAMAISINKDDYAALFDFYNGSQDLKKKLVRVLHEKSLLDDPTRILRAIRFEQRLRFALEPNTLHLIRCAHSVDALRFVHPHRLRDELIMILKEDNPYRYLTRIEQLVGFSFIDQRIKRIRRDQALYSQIKKSLTLYHVQSDRPLAVPDTFHVKYTRKSQRALLHEACRHWQDSSVMQHREPDTWLPYLMALVIRLPCTRISEILHTFGFRKSERLSIVSVKQNLRNIVTLKNDLKPHKIYRSLHYLSFESIIFFYAYHVNRTLRHNIQGYFQRLIDVRLRVKGEDLKSAGIKPLHIYSRIFEQLLNIKLDSGFDSKEQELRKAHAIARRLIHRLSSRS